jgi:hypothetical protein
MEALRHGRLRVTADFVLGVTGIPIYRLKWDKRERYTKTRGILGWDILERPAICKRLLCMEYEIVPCWLFAAQVTSLFDSTCSLSQFRTAGWMF